MLERAEINPNLVLEQLSNIVALAKQHGFADIFIAKPCPGDDANIMFILSRQSEGVTYIRFSVNLHKLLKVDLDYIITRIQEDLKPEFFNEYYKENILSLLTSSADEVSSFFKDKLNIEVNTEKFSAKKATVSQAGKFSNNNKESLFEEKEATKFSPKRTNSNQS